MSSAEVLLWTRLRGRSDERPTFRRQHPIGSGILDFYCPSARQAVEVDGATHWDDQQRARDAARDSWLARQGVTVMRIPASAVYRDVGAVVDAILLHAAALRAAEARRPRPAPSTARSAAGGPPPASASRRGR